MRKSLYSKRQERLSALLRAARKHAGLSQIQLAKKLGAYKTYVSKYEKGERRLDVVEFLAVAQALRLDPAEMLAKVKE
jgi:transcriptional regulator with XRE-family HTH domain